MTGRERIDALLAFWFGPGEARRDIWFQKNDEFDRACAEGFLDDHRAAAAGSLDHWLGDPAGALALVLLLDQIPRNVFRGSPLSWATDEPARAAARRALAAGHDRVLPVVRGLFLYLPFEHSEDLDDQDLSVRLITAATIGDPNFPTAARSAERHREIIARFGRFPHRNAILGRASTAEEIEFLKEKDSSF